MKDKKLQEALYLKKLLTFAVPCFNSEAYMTKCIDSLLPGGEEVEIIIVDDGSSDGTAKIADEYAERYPDICRVIHQENAGHGGAVNTGMAAAKGIYFKVVDSDDWVDPDSYREVLEALRRFKDERVPVDLLIANYVYEHVLDGKSHAIRYTNALPEGTLFGWEEARHFRMSQNLLMHSVIYRTRVLRDCGLHLPEHTFYVDNLFVYIPLPYVRRIYYLNTDFYRYYIGREDQSVNEKTMISRIDQQILVNRLMVDAYDLYEDVQNRHLRNYMFNYLTMIFTVTSVMLILSKDPENTRKRDELWKYFREKRQRMWRRIRIGIRGQGCNARTKAGKMYVILVYRACQKIFKFN